MKDYANGKIYRLENKNNSQNFYIGSTTSKLEDRLYAHKMRSREFPDRKLYKFVADNGGWDNFQIILIENWPCCSQQALYIREAHHYKILNPDLNTYHPMRTAEEKKEKYDERIYCDLCMKKVSVYNYKQHSMTKQHQKMVTWLNFKRQRDLNLVSAINQV